MISRLQEGLGEILKRCSKHSNLALFLIWIVSAMEKKKRAAIPENPINVIGNPGGMALPRSEL